MSKNLKETVSDAGKALADSARKLGNNIAEGTQQAARTVSDSVNEMVHGEGKDRGIQAITEHMPVVASCGKCVGTVDHLESNSIKLTRKDSPDGLHHYVPLSWIDHVDTHVHLNKNSVETELNWKPSVQACDC